MTLEMPVYEEIKDAKGNAKRTMGRHLNPLFLPGGEIVREVMKDEEYDMDPKTKFRDSVEGFRHRFLIRVY